MAVVTKRPSGKDFTDTPKSSLSKSDYITKPEQRAPNTHNYNVAQGERQLLKTFNK